MLYSLSLPPPESGSIPSARTPAMAASPGSRTVTATASNCGSLWLTRACFYDIFWLRLPAPDFLRSDYQAQSKNGDDYFADGSYCEGAEALFAHFAEIGAQANACKGEQEGPAGKI